MRLRSVPGLLLVAASVAAQSPAPNRLGEYRSGLVHILVEGIDQTNNAPVTSRGSGFLASRQGHVVTARHLFQTDGTDGQPRRDLEIRRIVVTLGGPEGNIIGSNPATLVREGPYDVAILVAPNLPDFAKPIPFCSHWPDGQGQPIVGIGMSLGGGPRQFPGTISQTLTDDARHVTVDFPANPGDSGGPVIGPDGAVVGIIMGGVRTPNGVVQGINAYLPLRRFYSTILQRESQEAERCGPISALNIPSNGPVREEGGGLPAEFNVRVNIRRYRDTPRVTDSEIGLEGATDPSAPLWSGQTTYQDATGEDWYVRCQRGTAILLRARVPSRTDIAGPTAFRTCGETAATEVWIGSVRSVINDLLETATPLTKRINEEAGSSTGLCTITDQNYADPLCLLEQRSQAAQAVYRNASQLLKEAVDLASRYPTHRARALSDLVQLHIRARSPCRAVRLLGQEMEELAPGQRLPTQHPFRIKTVLVESFLESMTRCAAMSLDMVPEMAVKLVQLAGPLLADDMPPRVGGTWVPKLRSAQHGIFGLFGANVVTSVAVRIEQDSELWGQWDHLFEVLSVPSCRPAPPKVPLPSGSARYELRKSIEASISLQRTGRCA